MVLNHAEAFKEAVEASKSTMGDNTVCIVLIPNSNNTHLCTSLRSTFFFAFLSIVGSYYHMCGYIYLGFAKCVCIH